MLFALSDEQQLIIDSARKLLLEQCPVEDLRRMLANGSAQNAGRWLLMGDMGLLSTLVSVERGGLGLGEVDFVGIAEAAGYVALPEPLVEQGGIVVPLLASLNDDRGWLERALAGEIVVAGHPAQRLVSNADEARALLVATGDTIHLIERADVELMRQESIDPLRHLYTLSWTPMSQSEVCAGDAASALWATAFERGVLFSAAQSLGLAQRCVDIAVDYAKDRIQFGKPIGSYQAVKHMLANVQVQIEFARPVLLAAAAEFPVGGAVAEARASHAKPVASATADLAARTALQVHGAMGFTWEVDLHFFLKRALALGASWGSNSFHRKRVTDRMLNFPIGPDAIFARELT
jgi:alkylation response protein AidB-like acyl-CoA dehydrogenase